MEALSSVPGSTMGSTLSFVYGEMTDNPYEKPGRMTEQFALV